MQNIYLWLTFVEYTFIHEQINSILFDLVIILLKA